jgi:hypothetical protein
VEEVHVLLGDALFQIPNHGGHFQAELTGEEPEEGGADLDRRAGAQFVEGVQRVVLDEAAQLACSSEPLALCALPFAPYTSYPSVSSKRRRRSGVV